MSKLLEIIEEGNWTTSVLFMEMKASCEWCILPSLLGICDSEDDLLMMSAYVKTVGDIEAVDAHYQKIEMDRKV